MQRECFLVTSGGRGAGKKNVENRKVMNVRSRKARRESSLLTLKIEEAPRFH